MIDTTSSLYALVTVLVVEPDVATAEDKWFAVDDDYSEEGNKVAPRTTARDQKKMAFASKLFYSVYSRFIYSCCGGACIIT